MFDPNAMAELAAIKRAKGGTGSRKGGLKVYNTAKHYWDNRGYKEMSPFRQACIEMLHRYRQTCQIQREHFRMDCLTSKEGFYHGESIPF